MSTNSPALGSRENFFAHGEDTYQGDDTRPSAGTGHAELQGVSREGYIAGSILRSAGDPTLVCPVCFEELEATTDLSDPEDYVPPSEVVVEDEDGECWTEEWYADHRRHRHCESHGHIVWGGILQDREREAFIDIVEHVLDFCDLRESRRDDLLGKAISRKDRGLSDEANMETLIHELEAPAE
jgi:hypothetical protein